MQTDSVKPHRRRIPITIVEPSSEQPASSPAPTAVDFMNPVATRTLSPPNNPKPSSPVPNTAKPPSFKEASQARKGGKSATLRVGGGIFRSNGTHIVNTVDYAADKQKDGAESTLGQPPQADAKELRKDADVEQQSKAAETPVDPGYGSNGLQLPHPADGNGALQPPMTLFTFNRSWDALSSPKERWALLCVSF